MRSFLSVVLLVSIAAAASSAFTGPLSMANIVGVQEQKPYVVLPPNELAMAGNSNWTFDSNQTCMPYLGKIAWFTPFDADMTGVDNILYTNVHTFGALFNSNGHLHGVIHLALSNMSYDYKTGPYHFWWRIPANSGGSLDLPVDRWASTVQFEEGSKACDGTGMLATDPSLGTKAFINDVNGLYSASKIEVPLNKSAALASGFAYAPGGDACFPGMGCHFFRPDVGAPIFTQWVIGYDNRGNLQFIEVSSTTQQPYSRGQWDFIPAGLIHELGDNTFWLRHVHVKPIEDACPVLCGVLDDCHPSATCSFNPTLLPPYFTCTCPDDGNTITSNYGRGPSGCSQCGPGLKPNPNKNLCISKCTEGYVADANGDCQDIDECLTAACASDEDCLNLRGSGAICLFKQVPASARGLVNALTINDASEAINNAINDPSIDIVSFTFSKTGTLTVKVNSVASLSQETLQNAFATLAGGSLNVVVNAELNSIVASSPDAEGIDYNEAPASGTIVVAFSALYVLAPLVFSL